MKKALILFFCGLVPLAGAAQIRLGDGQLSGSLESNTIYYMSDDDVYELPEDQFGTNNYLKIDYTYGRFSAGIQMEGYLPALQGYPMIGNRPALDGIKLASKYVAWTDDNYSFLVGDIYDQFGNGLIFRSYEDRALGFNNSLQGVKGSYRFGNYVHVKGMYGQPRLYMDYAGSWVRGLDLSISLADILNLPETTLALEGSYVNRYESLDKDENISFDGLSPNLNMYSGRINIDWKGIKAQVEYVTKDDKDIYMTNLVSAANAKKGNVLLAELGYDYKRFSILGSFRRLEYMGTLLSLYGEGTGNLLNYIPALTRQYTYLLTNLNPYQVNTSSEIGGQVDVYYSLRNKQTRSKYWNFHANFSTYYTIKDISGASNLLWRDINVDVERQWNRSWKTSLLFTRQEWDPTHGGAVDNPFTYVSNIVVADVTWKINNRHSLRLEAQYLQSDDDEKDWVAGLLEYSIAPKWSIFVSDMYNHGNDNKDLRRHYYNGGFSFTKNRTRVQLSYGRNREGFVCSGGVCRSQPAYTGINLLLTSSF